MKTNGIRAVLFDLDGTLVDGQKRLYLSCLRAFRQLGLTEPGAAAYWDAFQGYELERLIPSHRRREFFTLVLEYYCSLGGEVTPIPGAREALQFCRDQGYGTAVVTGRMTSPGQVLAELARTDLSGFIDVVKTHEGVHVPAMLAKEERLLQAVEELGATPAESIYVGDLPDDISSARRAGLRLSVAVLTGGIRRELLASRHPDVILDSVKELPGFLAQQ